MVDQRWKFWFPGVRTSQILTCVPTPFKMWENKSANIQNRVKTLILCSGNLFNWKESSGNVAVCPAAKQEAQVPLSPSLLLGRCMPPLFAYFGKEASHVSWESTKAWQLPTAPVNRRRAAQAGLDHLKQHGGELRSDSLQDKFTLLLFGCLVQNVKLIFWILFFRYVLKWGAEGEPTQFGMSG